MKANLVCKGGGIRGIALVGAISYLEEQGYEWLQLAGTSAGAIVASLLAVGYNSNEIKEMLYDLDYTMFKDKNLLHYIPFIGPILSLTLNKGLYKGNAIEKYLASKFKDKNKTKFKDISVNGISKLKIIASDVSRKEVIIIPDDLIFYGIDPMEFEIAKAVRMSLSLPFYYNPVKIKYNKKCSFIVDGGLLSNFPLWIFDSFKAPSYPTFGLNLSDRFTQDTSCKSTKSYLFDIVNTAIASDVDIYYQHQDIDRTINVPTFNISPIDFEIPLEDKIDLFNSGYDSAKQFLKTWNFDNYIHKYYD